jgi:hypothetical protein
MQQWARWLELWQSLKCFATDKSWDLESILLCFHLYTFYDVELSLIFAVIIILVITYLLIWVASRSRQSRKHHHDTQTGHTSLEPFDDDLPSHGKSALKRLRASRSRANSKNSVDFTGSEADEDDYFEFLASDMASAKDNPMKRINYYGPSQCSLVYESLVPPPSWSEVNRQVIPPDRHFRLQRYLALTLTESSTLAIHHTTKHSTEAAQLIARRQVQLNRQNSVATRNDQERDPPVILPLEQVSLHVLKPVQNGIIQIYVKDSTAEEWMEHTLPSAALAAQFQTDVVALQVLGPAIHSMYASLQLIHQGSRSHKGKEFVWHDRVSVGNDTTADNDALLVQPSHGVAWDDCIRCLGSTFPSIRLRLEALWWKQATDHSPSDAMKLNENTQSLQAKIALEESTMSLKADYVKKRLLLGPIDFIRLFIPHLPETAVPRHCSSKLRVEQLFRWRKRVAQASLLVDAYCHAQRVVNKGWRLCESISDGYWKRRMAFDDNIDNVRWDSAADSKHTYYEGTVSRDVICNVRGSAFCTSRTRTALSLTQGYSLVEIHTLKVSLSSCDCGLKPERDPVKAIQSLRSVIESHPELDFFVSCIHIEAQSIWHIAVFVRCLPEGIDPSFDAAARNFNCASPSDRDRKLEVLLHLGTTRNRLSWKSWLFVKLLSGLSLGWSKAPLQSDSSGDRTSLPAFRLSSCGDVKHFGGCLRLPDDELPSNYVAHVASISSKRLVSFPMRICLYFLENPDLTSDVVDVSYIISGESEDELPERTLGTYRMVQFKLNEIGLSPRFLAPTENDDASNFENSIDATQQGSQTGLNRFIKVFVFNPLLATLDPLMQLFRGIAKECPAPAPHYFTMSQETSATRAKDFDKIDPIDQGVDEVLHLLENIDVIVRSEHLIGKQIPESETNTSPEGLVTFPAAKLISHHDVRRFFVASGCNHSKAAIRIVDTIAWRGRTLPIDARMCRIELHTGQFFQQGSDNVGNPVFYFRCMCLGTWRKDENAAIAAVLFRFEQKIAELERFDPYFRCTVVVCLGKPHLNEKRNASRAGESNSDNSVETGVSVVEYASESTAVTGLSNPRVEPDEIWSPHASKRMASTLIKLLTKHYPERLYRAFVVVGHGDGVFNLNGVRGLMQLSKYVRSSRTKDKVRFLNHYSELKEYIPPDELITYCCGNALINEAAFECRT